VSVNPVTITLTTEDPRGEAHIDEARTEAARQLGLDRAQVLCLDMGQIEVVEPAVWSERIPPLYSEPNPNTGATSVLREEVPPQLIKPEKLSYQSTWGAKPSTETASQVPAHKVEWPEVKLSRGARWHGVIPDEQGQPIEANLISDGEKLVLIDSPEGWAVLGSMQ
jgi:hypothetical protein